MAQRVAGIEGMPAVGEKDLIVLDDEQPKRLKQGRLPFKPLDCKPVIPSPVVNNSVSRKRKTSEPNSPSSKVKQPKLPDLRHSAEKLKPLKISNDNEVSSSSEAENVPATGSKSRATKNNLLEKFVRREDEISSTNDVIDLTGSGCEIECNENSPAKVQSPRKLVLKSPSLSCGASKEKPEEHFARKLVFDEVKTADCKQKLAEINGGEEASPGSVSPKKGSSTCEDVSMECEDVECTDLCEKEEEGGAQMVEDVQMDDKTPNTSVLETSGTDADTSTSTPQKEGDSESSEETPGSKQHPVSASTPQTPGSMNTSSSSIDGAPTSGNKPKRPLSKKQAERAALRQKIKDEKEKQKQEAKEQKEKDRLEKKRKRDEEKAEKDRAKQEEKEKKEKERLEKKEQMEKEKQEKLQQKEEEKKKKMEQLNAKLEEKKKKEEERKQKEEQKQKEEEEKLRQAEKTKAAFTSFFTKPKAVSSSKVDKAADNLFIPFEVKKDMTLAPVRRQVLSPEDKHHLDDAMRSQESSLSYLQQLRQGIRQPVKTNRVLRKKKEVEQDVELILHDSEAVKKVTHAVKLLQFHTDYRPPYYGTWRKKVPGLSPRNPWKKDENVFDYEVDSDEEWEEEEPGESLSDSNGEEEEGDEEEEGADEDGWMVPHGYLSEDEGCEDDEEVTPEVLKARQRAKAQAWEVELKAKKQMVPPLHLGCFWLDNPCVCAKHLDILKQFEMIFLRGSPVETLISCPAASETVGDRNADKPTSKTTPSSKGFRKRALPEEAMPDLIHLVHGNSFGIKKLVREFRLYWKQRSSNSATSPSKSQVDDEADILDKACMDTSTISENGGNHAVQDPNQKGEVSGAQPEPEPMQTEADVKTDQGETPDKKLDDSVVGEGTEDICVSKRQLEMKIMAIATREKREGNKRHCWYVSGAVLEQYNMADLPVQNTWVYLSGDMTKRTPSALAEKRTPHKSAEKRAAEEVNKKTQLVSGDGAAATPLKEKKATDGEATPKAGKSKRESSAKKNPKDQPSIMAFTKKTPTEPASERKNKHKNVSDENISNTLVVKDENISNTLVVSVNDENISNTLVVTDVDMENGSNVIVVTDIDMETGSKEEERVMQLKPQGRENQAETNVAESSVMEEDCIILD